MLERFTEEEAEMLERFTEGGEVSEISTHLY